MFAKLSLWKYYVVNPVELRDNMARFETPTAIYCPTICTRPGIPKEVVVTDAFSAFSAVCLLLKSHPMETVSPDIVFACPHCTTSLVVDAAAAGLTFNCQKCSKPVTVPRATVETSAANAVRISEIQHQLKENESQRTEITSYINQLSIQLHRWQLRLQSLNERQAKLQTELAQLSVPPG
jgi:ribosomal protein L37AE/L43A